MKKPVDAGHSPLVFSEAHRRGRDAGAIQVRNHRLPIQKMEWMKNGTWVEVPREPYNSFVASSGMGLGPVTIRITATDGQTLVGTLPRIEASFIYDGAKQFALQ